MAERQRDIDRLSRAEIFQGKVKLLQRTFPHKGLGQIYNEIHLKKAEEALEILKERGKNQGYERTKQFGIENQKGIDILVFVDDGIAPLGIEGNPKGKKPRKRRLMRRREEIGITPINMRRRGFTEHKPIEFLVAQMEYKIENRKPFVPPRGLKHLRGRAA